jgi:hypothetical protein
MTTQQLAAQASSRPTCPSTHSTQAIKPAGQPGGWPVLAALVALRPACTLRLVQLAGGTHLLPAGNAHRIPRRLVGHITGGWHSRQHGRQSAAPGHRNRPPGIGGTGASINRAQAIELAVGTKAFAEGTAAPCSAPAGCGWIRPTASRVINPAGDARGIRPPAQQYRLGETAAARSAAAGALT